MSIERSRKPEEEPVLPSVTVGRLDTDTIDGILVEGVNVPPESSLTVHDCDDSEHWALTSYRDDNHNEVFVARYHFGGEATGYRVEVPILAGPYKAEWSIGNAGLFEDDFHAPILGSPLEGVVEELLKEVHGDDSIE